MLRITFFVGYWFGFVSNKGNPFLERALVGLLVGTLLALLVYGIGRAFGKDLTKR